MISGSARELHFPQVGLAALAETGIERDQMHRLTQAKLEGWIRDKGAYDSGKKSGKASDSFAKALLKAAKQEADRDDREDKDRKFDKGLDR